MAAVCAKVEAANKLQDPLEAFPVFKKYDRNGLNVSIECRRVSGLEPSTLDWAFELTKANMQTLNRALRGRAPRAPSTQMKKVMLTVFKHNHGAYQFFREALQFEVDAPSPSVSGCCGD
ncbi:PREDICTED: N-alpha-acetyltransferase 40, partial [Corvus brachyrhynchos]|uniref:N-alpha-acetyltransferase 40 n=1 Tax=Corvus brachyrhynchos TaxID=85066 RepID=UPI0008164329